MFSKLYDPLYEALPDRSAYLQRIGFEGECKPDKRTLDALVLAHQCNVPFENLDIYDAGADISLGITDLFDKIVTRRRGGFCFELNAIFMSLLQSVGFECYPVAVRIVWHATRAMPITHRATIVVIDGEKYYCDVGFGGPSPQGGARLEYGVPQQIGNATFVFEKEGLDSVISRVTEDGNERLQMFMDVPVEPVDFIAPCFFQSKSEMSGFKMVRMLNLTTKSGAVALNGNVLRVHRNGETEESTLETEDALREAIEKHYGIKVDFALRV